MNEEVSRIARLVLIAKARVAVEMELGLRAPDPHDFFSKTTEQGIPNSDAGCTVEEGLEVLTKMDPEEGFPFDCGDLPRDYISALTAPKGEYSFGAVS